MRAAIYARVSSAAQRERHTIENQLRALPAYVASQGWSLAGTYVDDGRSAKAGQLEHRDGFARLVRDAEAKLFDILAVVDVDRLTRTDSIEERAKILGPFQRLGIDIVTPSGGRLDMRTMLGELWVTIQALGAAEENRKRAERIKAGKLRAIAEGRKPAGPTPYGLHYDRETGTWSIDEATAAIVREIFRRVIGGESCVAIADDLHARAVPPPRGPWSRSKVWHIVRSRHPMGTWVADKQRRLTMPVPAMIDAATWHAAQDKLIEHGKRGLVKTKHIYLLEGLALCGACGSPMLIRSSSPGRRGRVNPPAYVCRRRKLDIRHQPRCDSPVVKVADADRRVWARIESELATPEFAAEVAARIENAAANRLGFETDVADYKARLAKLAKVETGVLARYQRGVISDEAFDAALASIVRERALLSAQLDRATEALETRDSVPVASAEEWVAVLRDLAGSIEPAARQRVVRAMVRRGAAVFDGERVRLKLRVDLRKPEERAPGLSVADPGYRSGYGTTARQVITIRLVA